MIKGIIFDLDGTLLNTIDDIADSINAVLKKHGLPTHTVEEYKTFVGSGAKVLITSALGEKANDEKLYKEVFDEYIEYYGKHREDKTAPYAGIVEMLEKLKSKYRLGVLSNKPHADTVPMVKAHFGDEFFDFVYGQRDGIPRKPDPTVVYKMINDMGLTVDEVMYVGDSENDVLRALGVPYIRADERRREMRIFREYAHRRDKGCGGLNDEDKQTFRKSVYIRPDRRKYAKRVETRPRACAEAQLGRCQRRQSEKSNHGRTFRSDRRGFGPEPELLL